MIILPESLRHANRPSFEAGHEVCSQGHGSPPPSDYESSKQSPGIVRL